MESEKENRWSWVVWILFCLLGVYAIARYIFGNYQIGSWFEKPGEYKTQYWVYLQPDSRSSKNYRLKGDVSKASLGEDGWGYYLNKVYWNDGGHSDFDDCQLTTPKGDYCEDIKGKGYIIRLGEHVGNY